MLFFRNLGAAVLDLLLPPRCHICRTTITGIGPLHLCADCQARLPGINAPVCTVCGIPFDGAGTDHPCGRCMAAPPPYAAARAAFRFEGSCRDLIHAFKYTHKSHLRRPLGLLMARALQPFVDEFQPELLLPVPLHRSRLRQRGFNQAVLLGEILAQQWQLPLLRQGLVRIRPTTPQVELTHDQRMTNLQGAFTVRDASTLAGRRIMLVDDVFTTGSTLSECAKVLRQAGAGDVIAATIAHAT